MNKLLVWCSLIICQVRNSESGPQFPANFQFGAATAAYQIEGAWNVSGKGLSIWDTYTHNHPDWIADRTNGDVACDSYHRYDEDINNLAKLKVDFYRFSLSWSRLLPLGFTNKINQDGVDYYNKLINGLLAKNIAPMITIYHWDLPQTLQEIGGWTNELIIQYYADYANTVFQLFGDRVKDWITFNEPLQFCHSGYGMGVDAPGYKANGIADYLCSRTVLLAHAKAWRLYDNKFRKTQHGRVGITLNANWFEPATKSSSDKDAAERSLQFTLGWWAHPIFSKDGNYPGVMLARVADASKKENFTTTRLMPFSKQETKLIKGTFDFFGLNHYTSLIASNDTSSSTFPIPSFENDLNVKFYFDPKWPSSGSSWLKVVPWGFRKLLQWIKKEYNSPLIYITENGFSDNGNDLKDLDRINYYKGYLTSLLNAMTIDGCNVTKYTTWSLMDNFEWSRGYTERFGLIYVNMTTENRTRTWKESAYYYRNVIESRIPNPQINVYN